MTSRVAATFSVFVILVVVACGRRDLHEHHPDAAPKTAKEPPQEATLPVAPPPSATVAVDPVASKSGAIPSFADLAARADPAVVYIETEQAMFGHGRRIVAGGVGTGFVFDPSGLILTNYHVVASATRIDAVFGAEDRRRATVVGTDAPTDIAVLHVDGAHFSHLPLGDSDQMRVGDWVVAIGNPFGLSHTVSAGILSAKGRTRNDVKGLDASGYYDYLQTDASINPGNSGGPLLDLGGRVIGINTAIKPEANSIGFAIPINMVRELLPQLAAHGKVRRSALGVVVASVKEEDVARLGLAGRSGAIVTRIFPGGSGSRAGIQVDDIILALDGAAGAGPNRLRWLTSVAGVGKRVRLKVARAKHVLELDVVLGELPEPPQEAPEAPP